MTMMMMMFQMQRLAEIQAGGDKSPGGGQYRSQDAKQYAAYNTAYNTVYIYNTVYNTINSENVDRVNNSTNTCRLQMAYSPIGELHMDKFTACKCANIQLAHAQLYSLQIPEMKAVLHMCI